jgi:hypothetical protein
MSLISSMDEKPKVVGSKEYPIRKEGSEQGGYQRHNPVFLLPVI